MRSLRWLPVLIGLVTACVLLFSPTATVRAKPDPYEVVTVKDSWVTIRGTCRIEKAVPIPSLEDRHAGETWEVPSPRIRFDPTHLGLADCVVFLKSIKQGKPWFERTGYVMIVDDSFRPQVQVLPPNTGLKIINTHARPSGIQLRLGGATVLNYCPPADSITLGQLGSVLTKPGFYRASHHLHPSYSASIVVARHPYYSTPTSTTGRYEITRVPPGTYELICWHAGMRHEATRSATGRVTCYDHGPDVVVEKRVEVAPGKPLTVDFELPAP